MAGLPSPVHTVHREASLSLSDRIDVQALGARLPVIVDGCLSPTINAGIWAQGIGMAHGEAMVMAGVGRQGAQAASVRSDWTRWIDPADMTEPLVPLGELFGAVGRDLSRWAYMGLHSFELQLALYREGAFYARHVDAFRGGANRRVTAIYYPNISWRPGDGGELEVWTAHGVQVIEPVAQRLVVFLSEGVEHAVTPVRRAPRLAFTAWFRGAGL